jgi:hypothetical protein
LTPISLRYKQLQYSYLRLGYPRGLFTIGSSINIFKALVTNLILAVRLAHLNLPDFVTITVLGGRYKILSFSA